MNTTRHPALRELLPAADNVQFRPHRRAAEFPQGQSRKCGLEDSTPQSNPNPILHTALQTLNHAFCSKAELQVWESHSIFLYSSRHGYRQPFQKSRSDWLPYVL